MSFITTSSFARHFQYCGKFRVTFDDMSHYNADSLCVRDKLNTSKLYCVLSLSKSLLSTVISPPLTKNGRWTFKLFSFWNRRVAWSKKIPLVTHTKINDSAIILFKRKFSSQNDAIYNLNKGTIGKWYLERNYLKSVWIKISVELNRFSLSWPGRIYIVNCTSKSTMAY